MPTRTVVAVSVIASCVVAAVATARLAPASSESVSSPSTRSAEVPAVAASAAPARRLSIATGGTGGVYYPLGTGIANLLGQAVPGLSVTAQVTGGSVANLHMLATAKTDIVFTQVDAAWDALKGQDKFTAPVEARTISVLYPNHLQVVTTVGLPIDRVEDLRGKRVSTGSPGSAGEVFANRLLEAAGLDPVKDIKRERLGVTEAASALRDKKIDAFIWVGGIPTAAISDLAATPSFKIKLLESNQFGRRMNEKYGPLYRTGTIPKGTYGGMANDNTNLTVWNVLAVHRNMPEDQAYEITKTVFERRGDLAPFHAEAANIKRENQSAEKSGLPFHPGAKRYFEEQGLRVD